MIRGAISYRLGLHEKGEYTKNKFQYIKEWDVYACSNSMLFDIRKQTTLQQRFKY